jgi:gamma-glutamyltranspeptidase/glutathione hydrolase
MPVRNILCTLLVSACLIFAACSPATDQALSPDAAQPTVQEAVNKAAVAMPDSYGAQVSEDILRAGGNAVDAAIAAGFALAVTYPEAGNIGGGGFMLIHIDGEATFLDYRETAPLAAHRDMYLDEQGDIIEKTSLIGIQAAGVPGTVAGLWAAHQRYGSLAWKDLLMPAVDFAANGFLVTKDLADRQLAYSPRFAGTTNFDEHFGNMVDGAVFKQPELARTLLRIAASGAEGFYAGETAKLIVEEMERGDGLITADDLARYRAVWREPLKAAWRAYEVLSAPPPSSGGFAVIQLLKIKDYTDHHFQGLEHNSPQYIHLVAEIEKRVFADRAEYLGDPDYVDVPIAALLDEDYIASRAQQINSHDISSVDGVPPGLESRNTTHYSILDRWGNAVSNTYTINDLFGNGVVVEGAGFLLNGEMDDFSIKPGVPNLYGVVGNTANEIQPGKRMLSSMSPTILLKDGEVAMIVGTPGGSTIFTSVFQTIVNILDFGMTPGDAVAATRFHHQLLPPDLVTYSPKRPLPRETISALGDRGYRAEPHFFSFGDVQVILRDGDDLQAASDPRNRGQSIIVHH